MRETLLETIQNEAMLQTGDKVLVGLSGGADSVCLLLNLLELKAEFSLEISAIHINHQLRGAESDRDERFCTELCGRLAVPLIVERADVLGCAASTGKSVEEAARDLRYEAFARHAAGGKIATAHTLSDSAETVLFNLTRGTGLKGLCGIPPVRGNIVRPLIRVSREQVEADLRARGQDYITDSTNLLPDFVRNKLRLEALPRLREINPAVLSAIAKMQAALREENNYIEMSTETVYNKCSLSEISLNAALLQKEHPALIRRSLARFLERQGLERSYERILAVERLLAHGGKINLAPDVYIEAKMGILSIVKATAVPEICIEAGEGGTYDFLGRTVRLEKLEFSPVDVQNVNKKFANTYMDYDKIQGKVVIRNRRNGDRIQLLNRNFHSSVKTLFNADVPAGERARRIFLADEAGILFIEGFGISERVKPDENTKVILRIATDEEC